MNPIRRILAKLRRRKAGPEPLGRFFAASVVHFTNRPTYYFRANQRPN